MPLKRGVAGADFPLPVVPLPPSSIDATLVPRKLLGERLAEPVGIPVLPEPLHQVHAHTVQTAVGQLLGNSGRSCFDIGPLGLGAGLGRRLAELLRALALREVEPAAFAGN